MSHHRRIRVVCDVSGKHDVGHTGVATKAFCDEASEAMQEQDAANFACVPMLTHPAGVAVTFTPINTA